MRQKIGLIALLSFVGVLVVTTVVLGVVKKDYMPEFTNCAIEITVTDESSQHYYAGVNAAYSDSQKEALKQMNELFKNSYKQSVLASMLNGNLNNEVEIEYSATMPTQSGYRLMFEVEESVLMQNGSAYHLNEDSEDVVYTQIYFDVEEGAGFNPFNTYVKVQIDESRVAYYKLTTLANTQTLYDYVAELNFR